MRSMPAKCVRNVAIFAATFAVTLAHARENRSQCNRLRFIRFAVYDFELVHYPLINTDIRFKWRKADFESVSLGASWYW